MKFAMCLEPEYSVKWAHGRQMGVDHAVVLGPPEDKYDLTHYPTAVRLKEKFADAGYSIAALEGLISMENIKFGTPERDAELERLCKIIRNLGALDIPVLCYSWMAHVTWVRTSVTTRARGGALTTSYNHALSEAGPGPNALRITEDKLWETYRYFLDVCLPVAEAAGVSLSLHPDDPPLSPVQGTARIFGSPAAFDRAMAMSDSPAHGITFCQANFGLMGSPADVPDLIHRFGKRIRFVHFRDVRGDARNFVETFHDEGHTDMFACMQAYRDIGFDGPIRPDHAPAMEGDANSRPGYEALGRLFAIGYMRGLLEGVDAMRRGR